MYLLKLFCLVFVLSSNHTGADRFFDRFKGLFDPKFGKAAPPRESPKNIDQTCVCGQYSASRDANVNKIINGQEALPKYKYPWMVLLKSKGRFACGGALINNKFVVTAGHCVEDLTAADLEVVMGIHNIAAAKDSNPTNLTGEPFAIKRSITKVKKHGSLDLQSTSAAFDIALLKMSQPVTYTDQIKPICLPAQTSRHTLPPTKSIITGWGRTETGSGSDYLREAVVEAFSAEKCHAYIPGNSVTNEMICALSPDKHSCAGDSGGPMFYKTATSYTLIGITSWGDLFCTPESPGVYTRVQQFVNWIYTKTRGGKYCKNPDNGQ